MLKRFVKKVFPWSPAVYRQAKQEMANRLRRILRPVDVTGLVQVQPVSRVFGFDRGTPIDRYYITSFLKKYRGMIHGNVLEIADSAYSRRFATEGSVFHVLTKDHPPCGEKMINGDLTDSSSLPQGIIDCFICTQTLPFIYDMKAAIRGCHTLLSEGGILLCTVSGLSQISRYDMDRWGDYWRFTDLSIRKLMEEVFEPANVKVVTYGNMAAAIAGLQGLAVEDLDDRSILDKGDVDYPMIIGVVARK